MGVGIFGYKIVNSTEVKIAIIIRETMVRVFVMQLRIVPLGAFVHVPNSDAHYQRFYPRLFPQVFQRLIFARGHFKLSLNIVLIVLDGFGTIYFCFIKFIRSHLTQFQ